MSDRVAQSYNGSEGRSEQASYPYESVWMGHWMCTSCKSETKACGHVSFHSEEAQQHNHGGKKHSLFRGFGEVTEPKRVRKSDGGVSLIESSKDAREERWEGQSFPIFSLPPKTGLAEKNQILGEKSSVAMEESSKDAKEERWEGQSFPMFSLPPKTGLVENNQILGEKSSVAMPPWAPTDAWEMEATSLRPERQVKYHNFLENNIVAVSKSFNDELMRLDAKVMPHQFKGGSTSLSAFLCREEEINQSNSLLAPRQHDTNTNGYTSSTFLAHERNIIDNNFVPRRSGGSLSKQNDVVLLQHHPQKSDFVGENLRELQHQPGIGLLPSHRNPPEVTKLEKAYQGYCSFPSLQQTMRICAAVNTEEESSRGLPKISKSTHHFQFTKKNGVSLSEGGQIFGKSNISTKLKGKVFSELFGCSSEHGLPAQSGLKLLPHRSSADSEGEDVRDVETQSVESSSETDIMDMDAFQDNLLPGAASSSPSDKQAESCKKSSTSGSAFISSREEIGTRSLNPKLLDINQELPDHAAFASSGEERETSTSKTQSLGVENLLSYAENPANSKSSACPEGCERPEPSSSWVKRLKLGASQSVDGTKSSKMVEASPHETGNKVSSRIMRCSITSVQPGIGRSLDKEQTELDRTATLLRNGDSSSIDSVGKSLNITLSHPWIRRWSHNVASQKKSEAVVVYQSPYSKETVNRFQKKQFPSIAAMALMGKAMSGLNPSEFSNKGSFVVWNTKGF